MGDELWVKNELEKIPIWVLNGYGINQFLKSFGHGRFYKMLFFKFFFDIKTDAFSCMLKEIDGILFYKLNNKSKNVKVFILSHVRINAQRFNP